ncbi:MAG: aminodeoxychorismate synthase, component I, partial [Gammaproteobacteria bacterium]|nr:aminodeoxychorismate synthase, component I [Gammaproteobacteria bacterium]
MPIQSVDLPPDFDLLALHAANPGRYPALLESVATVQQGDAKAFDILFACPGDCLQLGADFVLHGPGAAGHTRFLDALDAWWRRDGGAA